MLSPEWIAARRPLWAAMSELWLDTQLGPVELDYIARTMAESGLTDEALREVYLVELAPVLWPNLLATAGEWAGFDQEWLCERILRNLTHHPRRTRFWSRFPLTRRMMTCAVEEYRRALMPMVARMREAQEVARDHRSPVGVRLHAVSPALRIIAEARSRVPFP